MHILYILEEGEGNKTILRNTRYRPFGHHTYPFGNSMQQAPAAVVSGTVRYSIHPPLAVVCTRWQHAGHAVVR
jgi:hypothetical protein